MSNTATKRLKEPIKNREAFNALPKEEQIKFMSDEEQAAYLALAPAKRKEYDLKLEGQKTKDKLDALRAEQAAEREKIKAEKDRERGIKQIITDVRKDDIQILRDQDLSGNQVIQNRLKELGVPEEEQVKVFERIKTDSVKGSSSRLIPAKPAYALSHSLVSVKRSDLIEPNDGGRPDTTLSNVMRRKGMIQPILVAPVMPKKEGEPILYRILDGKRRFWVMNEEDSYPAVIVTGFPDSKEEEQAEVIVNRVRNLNILSTARSLETLKAQKMTDTDIRREIGFKTGEIDKILSITELGADFQEALREGALTPNVALALAKLPKDLRGELAKDYAERKKADANARISEANVEDMRSRRAAEAIKRDTPTLSGLAEDAADKPEKTKGTENQKPESQKPGNGKPKTPKVDSKPEKKVLSKSAKNQAAPKKQKPKK